MKVVIIMTHLEELIVDRRKLPQHWKYNDNCKFCVWGKQGSCKRVDPPEDCFIPQDEVKRPVLVEVQRVVVEYGKPTLVHYWIKPSELRVGDTIVTSPTTQYHINEFKE